MKANLYSSVYCCVHGLRHSILHRTHICKTEKWVQNGFSTHTAVALLVLALRERHSGAADFSFTRFRICTCAALVGVPLSVAQASQQLQDTAAYVDEH